MPGRSTDALASAEVGSGRRIASTTVVALTFSFAVVLFALGTGASIGGRAAMAADESVATEWTPFGTDADASCADGSPVHYLERIADPARVVLTFEGGGACFSAATCAFDGPDSTYVSRSMATPKLLSERGGIFDFDDPRNPLAGHSFVYVPYCTGDVHLGDRSTAYSSEVVVEHRGYRNALIALEHLVETYPDAEEIIVAGMSAGSVPTPLFAGLVSDRLPAARIMTIGDSSGAYPDAPALTGLIGTMWGTMSALPDWPELEGMTVDEWSIPGLYVHAAAHAPDITFAKFDHAFDEAQAFYGRLVGVAEDDLVTLIDDIEAAIETTGADIASYVAPGGGHTVLDSDELYEIEVEGVRLIDWLSELVEGGRPADVHCVDCR
jgi:hypothetical protein